MVDFFILLMLAGAGDELQGIKRGIMEMADLLIINKADGENVKAAKLASAEYKRALHLFPPNPNEWIAKVSVSSSIEKQGMQEAWDVIKEFSNQQKLKGYFDQNRINQKLDWFDSALSFGVLLQLFSEKGEQISSIKKDISSGEVSVSLAIRKLLLKSKNHFFLDLFLGFLSFFTNLSSFRSTFPYLYFLFLELNK